VTRLLVAIKQLLEALTLWSTLKMSETQVSDVYVRLGNGFNEAVAAFLASDIDMSYVHIRRPSGAADSMVNLGSC
jgi:3'-phosphoadenosine 5'-phosphosulfate sulfotransferase